MDLLQEINEISKIHPLDRDDVDSIMLDFAKRITKTLKIERMSVWLLSDNNTLLTSAAEYDDRTGCLNQDSELKSSDYPNYFKAINENQIIVADDIKTNLLTRELTENYFIPNDVISLLDIPLRIEGDVIGVMCFEKTGTEKRNFTENEQIFALSIGIVFASNLEARHRRRLQHLLEKELEHKNTLIKEIHHRVKNNFAVVSGLIGLQTQKAKDSFHESLLNELRSKIISIAGVHEIVYNNRSYSDVNAHQYILKLTDQLNDFYQSDKREIELSVHVDEFELEVETMIPIALIINEVLTNCYKHAFVGSKKGLIKLNMTQQNGAVRLTIDDNGSGFLPGLKSEDEMLGIEIIKSLAEQLNGTYTYTNENGAVFTLNIESNTLD